MPGPAGGFWLAKVAFDRMPELIQREHPRLIPCQLCNKMISVERAIMRDDRVLCEKCYQKMYGEKDASEK